MPQICIPTIFSADGVCMQLVEPTDQVLPFPVSRDGEVLKLLHPFEHTREVGSRGMLACNRYSEFPFELMGV